MNEIVIPVPKIKLVDIVKRKAADAIDRHLRRSDLSQLSHRLPGYEGTLIREIEEDYLEIKGSAHQLLYISEMLIHLNRLYEQVSLAAYTDGDKNCLLTIQDIQYYFYNEISDLGFNIDTNSFTAKEVDHLTGKVEEIIDRLEKLQVSQEVIFDRIEELTEDYKDILTSFGLGKKPFLQRFAGVSISYVGEKGADEIFSHLKPMISELMHEGTRLLGQS
ncbi:hypothetical protein [Pedobacter panaciterrae]